ncbi:MAG: phenylalanine--tRNA ligase beta subunit-related protein [Thermoleophilaceae bacterium]
MSGAAGGDEADAAGPGAGGEAPAAGRLPFDEELVEGWVSAGLREEFPRLRLRYLEVEATEGRTGRSVRQRLRVMSDRFTGGKAVNMRLEPVPSAFRTFYRQVGIDPDQRRPAAEDLAVRRMQEGAFLSRGRVGDALTIAVAETGIPVLAFDAAALTGPLGLRLSRRDELLGDEGRSLTGGEIVVADERIAVAVLFVDQSAETSVGRGSKRIALAAVGVEGVPSISIEEALWTAAEALVER